jgi:hypothetical protein
VIDADCLIKLNLAGLLSRLVDNFSCVVPKAVYNEVVVEGRAHGHRDADQIDMILTKANIIGAEEAEQLRRSPGLGAGESSVFHVLSNFADATAISDDRQFLGVLALLNAPYFSTADIVVYLVRARVVTTAEAYVALEKLRPAINPTDYREALVKLELEGSV